MAGSDGSTLPGAPTEDDEERIVLHVDMDCFYAACERLRDAFTPMLSRDYRRDTARDEGAGPRMGRAFLS